MPKDDRIKRNEEPEEPLVDTTTAIPLHSKRTERLQKKRHLKEKASKQHATLWDLPSELVRDILALLQPSDVFILSRANRPLRQFILQEEGSICREIVARRYAVLSKCFPLPVLLEKVDKEAHPALLSDERQAILNIHKRPYQHIKLPDQRLICTCLTCMLAWNNLNFVVDFAYWQRNLDQGEPITMIPRGKSLEWNQNLILANADVVLKALARTLWYARILERHLNSTIGSIRRQGNNKGNKRRRFRMSVRMPRLKPIFSLSGVGRLPRISRFIAITTTCLRPIYLIGVGMLRWASGGICQHRSMIGMSSLSSPGRSGETRLRPGAQERNRSRRYHRDHSNSCILARHSQEGM